MVHCWRSWCWRGRVPFARPAEIQCVQHRARVLNTRSFVWRADSARGSTSTSTTRATIALSSAEAELYSLVKGAAQTLGMMALARDLGVSLQATVNTDASAALGIIQRQGLGKLRHVSTQFLWVQEKVQRNEFDIAKVPGQDNPADILTKNVAAELIHKHTETLGVWIGNGRAQTAPQLSSITGDPEGGDRDAWEE